MYFENSFIKIILPAILFLAVISCKKDDTVTEDDNPPPIGFNGDIEWAKTFGGSGEDDATSVTITPDGGIAVAGFTFSTDGDITDKTIPVSNFWVFKLDSQGELLWSKTYGGSDDDRATKIINTIDGGLAVVGFTRSTDGDVSQNNGFYDYWLLKLDSSGNKEWEKTYGYSGNDQGLSIIQTADGGFFLTGFLDFDGMINDTNVNIQSKNMHGVGDFWGIKTNAQGTTEWEQYYGGTNNDRSYDVVETPDGGFIMVGNTESVDFDITDPKGSYDFWAVRVNAVGGIVWQKNYGGSEIEIAYAIKKTLDGNYLILGDTRSSDKDVTNHKGNADVWLLKIDDNGMLLWQNTYGGSQFDTGRSIHELPENNLLVIGTSRSTDHDVKINYGQSDFWMTITNANGKIEFEKNYGGSNLDFGNSSTITPDNKIILAGSSQSTDFDVPENKGGKDALIIKLK